MGVKLKSDFGGPKDVPGPGSYGPDSNSIKQGAPKYGFGSSQRPGPRKDDMPGPGHYYIPTHIADAPDFAVPYRQMPEFKVV